jgi:hypothetical protein
MLGKGCRRRRDATNAHDGNREREEEKATQATMIIGFHKEGAGKRDNK